MSYRFTSEELLLISRAVASYQHNDEFRALIEKMAALTNGKLTKNDFYSSIKSTHPQERLKMGAR